MSTKLLNTESPVKGGWWWGTDWSVTAVTHWFVTENENEMQYKYSHS